MVFLLCGLLCILMGYSLNLLLVVYFLDINMNVFCFLLYFIFDLFKILFMDNFVY